MFSNALKEAYRNKQSTVNNCSKIENEMLSQSNMSSTHLLLVQNYMVYIKSYNGITFGKNTYLKLKHHANSHYIDNFDMIHPYKISFDDYITKFLIAKSKKEDLSSLNKEDKISENKNDLSEIKIANDLMKNNKIDYRYYKYNLIKAKRKHLFNAINQSLFNTPNPIFIGR